ncbi:MAG: DNA-binding protein [Nitrospinaceae bacterium]|nr:DNA-binding protein [Deltaproteobacteria bacterium]NIY14246.1 DNA-binding protein [Nitrospinaceae bacterium]
MTVPIRKITRKELELGRALYPEKIKRPKNRSECREGLRPCPFVGCRFHLYLDVNSSTGSIKLNFPNREPWELDQTCALDICEAEDGVTLEEIGIVMNLTRERVRQIEEKVLNRLKETAPDEMKEIADA